VTDAEFLRSVAHAIEVGDPVDLAWIVRMRECADRLAAHDGTEQVGWIDEHGNLWAYALRTGDVPSDRPVFA